MVWSMVWAPDDRLYVIELFGVIHALTFDAAMNVIDDHTVEIVTDGPFPLVLHNATYIFAMDSKFYEGRDEIIKSVKRGLYCQTFSNGQVQIGAGDFAFFVRQGYLIEDGKPVKGARICSARDCREEFNILM